VRVVDAVGRAGDLRALAVALARVTFAALGADANVLAVHECKLAFVIFDAFTAPTLHGRLRMLGAYHLRAHATVLRPQPRKA